MMHTNWPSMLRLLLVIHITSGVIGFICAPVALLTAKGGRTGDRFWIYRNESCVPVDKGVHADSEREDVLVVRSLARHDCQLHRCDDGIFFGQSFSLVWRCVVGLAVAHAGRGSGYCCLDIVLQEEICARWPHSG